MLICFKPMSAKAKTSTTKNPAWQVKGVTPETREAVKQAARKGGKTIGEWVNDALHKSAIEELTAKQNIPAVRVEDQLSEITARLDHLSQPIWKRIFAKSPKSGS